jgi:hypothetical protein
MSTKRVVATVLVGLLSAFSCVSTSEVADAAPTASQVEAWIKVAIPALAVGGASYQGFNTVIKDSEVRRDYSNRNGRVLFSYTANCIDRGNVSRFWQHPNNGQAANVIARSFPNNSQRQRQTVLSLINRACGSF